MRAGGKDTVYQATLNVNERWKQHNVFRVLYVLYIRTRVQRVFLSQAARQGLAVLMASAVVVLKHETLTLRQRRNFISIDFKFGVGDNVREVTNPDKVGSGPMSGRDATWAQHIRVLWLFIFFNRATAHTREPIFAQQ